MSDSKFHDWANTLGHVAAIGQRHQQIEHLKTQTAVLQEQTSALELQNSIEEDRASIERQRLEIERQRLRADEANRSLQRQQAEQLKELHNLMADAAAKLSLFRKRHLT